MIRTMAVRAAAASQEREGAESKSCANYGYSHRSWRRNILGDDSGRGDSYKRTHDDGRGSWTAPLAVVQKRIPIDRRRTWFRESNPDTVSPLSNRVDAWDAGYLRHRGCVFLPLREKFAIIVSLVDMNRRATHQGHGRDTRCTGWADAENGARGESWRLRGARSRRGCVRPT